MKSFLNTLTTLPITTRLNSSPQLLQILLLTALITGSAGLGFGLSLRLNRPAQAGSTLWHTDQTFPPREISPQSPQP